MIIGWLEIISEIDSVLDFWNDASFYLQIFQSNYIIGFCFLAIKDSSKDSLYTFFADISSTFEELILSRLNFIKL